MTKNKRLDNYIEFALLFILGILAGVAIKVEANKFLAIGFEDYKMKFSVGNYNINSLQQEIKNAAIETEVNRASMDGTEDQSEEVSK